ncbi:hypothetical protein [Methanomassiliicoccus luminyensis]|jgi:hypothetical protein|uniref:hypothetical protein n=1 Tax=Methanomassiliicoccus luminyensis TaxID=1080712 RepID=UPI0003727870|nr:hypothetical protein [Methanomassiliicoccus luminyensis]
MDRISKIALVSGIVILIATVALEVFGIVKQTTPVMTMGFYLLFFAFIQARRSRKGEVFGDERTWKLASDSLALSFMISYAALVVTYVLVKNEFLLLPLDDFIIFFMFVMLFSSIAGYIYFSRRRPR